MEQVHPVRKRCPECGKKRTQEQFKTYKTAKNSKGKLGCAPIINPNKKHCEGCIYWGGGYMGSECCNYIFIKRERRPCPAGKDCTVKVKGKRLRLPWGIED
jgi:hypothetical protein